MFIEGLTKCIVSRIGLFALAIGTFVIINLNPVPGMLLAQTWTQLGPNQRLERKVPNNWQSGTGQPSRAKHRHGHSRGALKITPVAPSIVC
jgi:hypothetical protein